MKSKGLRILLVVAALAVIAIVVKQCWRSEKAAAPVEKNTAIIDEAKTAAKIISKSVDEKGYAKTSLERKQAIIGNGDISKLPVSQAVIDSLRLDNLDKTKKLEQASLINATLNATALKATRQVDSLNHAHYVYSDDYAKVRFTPDSMGGKFDLSYQIKLIRQDYVKRHGFLNLQKTNYTDILSPDKRISINGFQQLTIEPPKRSRWAIGLQAGYYYDPVKRQFLPAIGVGVSYDLIQF